MAKAMLARVPSFCGWNKHLRRYGKRLFWKSERKAAKRAAERDGCAGRSPEPHKPPLSKNGRQQ